MIKRRNLQLVWIVAFILFLIVSILLLSKPEQKTVITQADGKERTFKVELAKTPEQQEKGLMGRTNLCDDCGMLFVYEQPKVLTFWMKNMKMSIDMIFADADGNIVMIYKNVPPCMTEACEIYSSLEEAKYVLEVNAGTSERLGLQLKDALVING